MYVTVRSWMSSVMDLIGPKLSDCFALDFAKIAESDFVYTLSSTNVDQLSPSHTADHARITHKSRSDWVCACLCVEKLTNFSGCWG